MAIDWDDPYSYPGSWVLINKFDIRDGAALNQLEYELTALRLAELGNSPITGKFDLAHMNAIHAHIFQDVYEWAGQVRTVDISKGGATFAHTAFIEPEMDRLNKILASDNYLRGLDKATFIEKFSDFYSEVNALHPYREGNGRATRELMGELAREAGFTLDQAKIDNSKGEFNEAARASFWRDLGPIQEFFSESVRYSRAVAFERLPEHEAVARHPELQGAFDAMRNASSKPGADVSEIRLGILKQLDAGQIVGAAPQEKAPAVSPPSSSADQVSAVQAPSKGMEL